MKRTVQKWGNSLALRLPKALANEAQICEGSKVELGALPVGLPGQGVVVVDHVRSLDWRTRWAELIAKHRRKLWTT